MEHITIKFGTGNAAFDESPTNEIARILRKIASDFERYGIPPSSIHDINGNYIGEIQIICADE